MNLDRFANLEDLRTGARRKSPRFVFDYIAGGAEDEESVEENRLAYRPWRFVPRYLDDCLSTSTEAEAFGSTWSAPFGIAPMGFAGLARPGADLMFARAAAAERIPYIMSGVTNDSLDDARP